MAIKVIDKSYSIKPRTLINIALLLLKVKYFVTTFHKNIYLLLIKI